MTVTLPPGYPELLGTLAASIEEELLEIIPDLVAAERADLAVQLTEGCRNTIGGVRVPALPRVPALDLWRADQTYETVAAVWSDRIRATRPQFPDAWRAVAVARLLDCLRRTVGGFIVPVGRALLRNRNEAMYRAFKGDFQAVALAFGVCAERARQIITAKLKADREARQNDLFGPHGG